MNNLQFTIYKKAFPLFIVYCLLFIGAPLGALAQSVDLVWQGNGYVPPFYKGRTLWSYQTQVHLMAIPQGLGDSSKLNYKWIQNGTVLGEDSGPGQNVFFFSDTVLSRTQQVTVQIVSGDGTALAEKSITLTPLAPSVVIYEKNPLYGFIFNKEVYGQYIMDSQETTLVAFPFFFNIGNREDQSLSYHWQVNSVTAETKDEVTFRAPADVSGTSAVSMSLTSADKLMQTARNSFIVRFGTSNEQQ